jgi:nitrogen-specific signal transduction histidine kinase/CheY-like chemotaxis protein
LRDVSEQRRLHRQVGLNDHLAALGALAAGVTQELENPLTFVIGNQQHARRELASLRELCDELGPKRAELARELCQEIDSALSAATSGAERVRAIGSELRKLGRPASSSRQTRDIRSALDTALTITYAQLSARARVIREFEVCPAARVDELQLTRVLVNLLSNAAQAIAPGAESSNEVRLAARTGAHGGALIEVKDSGSGINKADLPRIFEPFFTTREREGGAGLGLSIARGIVTSCGGSIEVESLVGAGSTFRVLLPASGEGAAAAVPRKRAAKGKSWSQAELGARLLFIDDEPILLDALTRALEGHYAVERASGASAALDLLADGNEYDLLVCDLMMPDVSGMDLFRAIQQRFPDSARRMVFMTGGAFTVPAQEFISEKGRRVLEKPFSNDELFAFVAACLDAFGKPNGPRPARPS